MAATRALAPFPTAISNGLLPSLALTKVYAEFAATAALAAVTVVAVPEDNANASNGFSELIAAAPEALSEYIIT